MSPGISFLVCAQLSRGSRYYAHQRRLSFLSFSSQLSIRTDTHVILGLIPQSAHMYTGNDRVLGGLVLVISAVPFTGETCTIDLGTAYVLYFVNV